MGLISSYFYNTIRFLLNKDRRKYIEYSDSYKYKSIYIFNRRVL